VTALPIAIAGLSVRTAAEAARRDGFAVTALDAFGDLDTRAASHTWRRLRLDAAQPWQIDPASLDAALYEASLPSGTPLLLTSGFAAEGAALGPWLTRWELGQDLGLRFAGTRPHNADVLRLPQRFFATLDALGLPHPPVAFTAPADPAGWLHKDFGGAGGAQVRHAAPAGDTAPGAQLGYWRRSYWQRELAGAPMSLTFLADGRRAALLGLNRQLLAPTPGQPWRFGGVIGPLPLNVQESERLRGGLDGLAFQFHLQGLCSLDLLDTPAGWQLLEVNPRWCASAALYEGVAPGGGLLRAHLDACAGHLPDAAALAALRGQVLRGSAIAYTRTDVAVTAARWQRLRDAADALDLHDLPAAPLQLTAGEPLCTLGAHGADEGDVIAAFRCQHAALAELLGGAFLAALPQPPEIPMDTNPP
jgi:predicted ATP-grasp superfamily ATP-dependent carboligase